MTKWVKPTADEEAEIRRYQTIADDDARKQVREQRHHERREFTAEVTLRSETNFYMGFSENISEGGIFLGTLSPPPVGETVVLEVTLSEDETISVEGVVRWHRVYPNGAATGCGVEFTNLSDGVRQKFERFIMRIQREPLFFET